MWSLIMLSGWAFALIVFAVGFAIFILAKIIGFAFDLWLDDPDLHRKKKDKDN